MVAELEWQVRELKEAKNNSLRKQLIDLGVIKEDTKQKVMWECEASHLTLASDITGA